MVLGCCSGNEIPVLLIERAQTTGDLRPRAGSTLMTEDRHDTVPTREVTHTEYRILVCVPKKIQTNDKDGISATASKSAAIRKSAQIRFRELWSLITGRPATPARPFVETSGKYSSSRSRR